MAKTIKLSNGKVSLVDEEDFQRLSHRKWHDKGNGYVMCHLSQNGKYISVLMHREILKAQKGEYVDHINGDTLDNRKCNLRISTNQQNACNSKLSKANTSGYKGVTWNKRAQKWEAQIMNNYKRIGLGKFTSKHTAASAYNRKALELWGEFAKLNVISEDIGKEVLSYKVERGLL